MNRQAIEEYFQSIESEALVIDGMDEAIIGVAQQFTNAPLVAYSMSKIINILMEQGMDHEEALEYFEFNIQGAWLGEGTPVIVDDMTADRLSPSREDAEHQHVPLVTSTTASDPQPGT